MKENPSSYIIGTGYGSLVNLKFKAPLGNEDMKYISRLHNGYVFVFYKTGIFGLVDIPDLLEIISPHQENYQYQDRPLIACVDDSLMISHMMEQIIGMAGYRFVAVNDPQDAVKVLQSRQPDLIFLDIVMPRINGYDL